MAEPSADGRTMLDPRGHPAGGRAPGDTASLEDRTGSGDPSSQQGPARTGRPPSTRALGIDVARGLALFMIIAAHVLEFATGDGGPTGAYVRGSEGAALFVLLAGVGVSLFTPVASVRRPEGLRRAAVGFTTRALAMIAIGLSLGYVVDYEEHAIVVLMTFGVLFLFAIPLLRLSAPALAAVSAVLALAGPVLIHLARPHLPTPELINPTFGDVFTEPLGWLSTLLFTGIYPAVPWAAYLCAGMALGRVDLSSVAMAVRVLTIGVVLAVVAPLTAGMLSSEVDLGGRLYDVTDLTEEEVESGLAWGLSPADTDRSGWWLLIDAPHSSTPLDLVRTTGIALAITGGCLLLSRSSLRPVLRPVAAAGSLTLSLYSLHLLALAAFPDAWGEPLTYACHVVAALVFGSIWLRRWRRGPLETVVRALEARAVEAAGSAPAPSRGTATRVRSG